MKRLLALVASLLAAPHLVASAAAQQFSHQSTDPGRVSATHIGNLGPVTGRSDSPLGAISFASRHALVVDEDSEEVLFEKDSTARVPIASLTKLMTAMVVMDAGQDPGELIRIDEADVDTLKRSRSHVPVRVALTRRTLLELALMSSDNLAAAALARNYPGGRQTFMVAVAQKLKGLGMDSTFLEEPTGLSPNNRSTAADLVKMVRAASTYPEIVQFTSQSKKRFSVGSRRVEYRNTNRLVGAPGWDILLSKTGFINEAGYCMAMRLQSTTKRIILVLLGAGASSQRMVDALNIQQWLAGGKTNVALATHTAQRMRLSKTYPARKRDNQPQMTEVAREVAAEAPAEASGEASGQTLGESAGPDATNTSPPSSCDPSSNLCPDAMPSEIQADQ